jgi:hypothetical protein
VILVDANLLVYSSIADFPQHGRSREWLADRLAGTARVGLAWPTLLAYLRLVTDPRIFGRPAGVQAAWQQVREWVALPAVWVPGPTERHVDTLERLLATVTAGRLVPDAHLAALAIEHGLTLCSADGDFARFAGLRWENPLA